MMALWRKKSISLLQSEANTGSSSKSPSRRVLGGMDLAMLGIGCTIGAGIFVITGHVAAANAGPAVVLSFILGGLLCAFAGLCYAEMASVVPVAGSAYIYAYATMGEFIAWLIGWDLVLEYCLGATAVAIGWSGYVTNFIESFGFKLPYIWTHSVFSYSPLEGWALTGALFNFPAAAIVALITAVLISGIRQSSRFNNVMVVVKVSVILAFVAAGLAFVDHSNWVTLHNPAGAFVPPSEGPGVFGWSGVLRGAAVVFFAYIGFDAVACVAQEVKDPSRNLPKGLLSALAVCTLLYVFVAYVLTGLVPYDQLNVADPVAVGVDALGLAWLSPVIKLGAICGLTSVILVLLISQPRLVQKLGEDGLLPRLMSKSHPRFNTPYIATMATGSVALLVAGFFPLAVVGELVSVGTLFAFVVVCCGVMVLRWRHPELPRGFRAPFVYIIGPLGAGLALFLMLGLSFHTWMRLVIWMALGLLIYFGYGIRHSVLRRKG